MKALAKQFGKAQVAAIVATVVDFLITAMAYRMSRNVLGSMVAGAVSGGVTNCVVNYLWTFRGTERSKVSVAMRYFLVWIGSVLLNSYGTEAGVKLLSSCFEESVSVVLVVKAVVAVLVAVLWNFTLQKCFVYKV